MENDIRIFSEGSTLARSLADLVRDSAQNAVRERGRFAIGLSGGSTPRQAFSLLAAPDYILTIPWHAMHVFWGDERCVPPDHPESNYLMARQALLDHVPVPSEHIYRMQGELKPQIAAQSYEAILRQVFPHQNGATLDLIMLGLGYDGHTASLFQGTSALQETRSWVVANHVPQLSTWRITLTPACINRARHVVFLVSGESKAGILASVLQESQQAIRYPAQLIRPDTGSLTWMVDQAAASNLHL